MRIWIFCSLVLLANASTYGQKKLIKQLFSKEKDTSRSSSYIPLPVFSISPETGVEFGLGSIYSFYIDRKDPNNRSSNLRGSASYSTKKNYNFKVNTDLWTKANTWHITTDTRFKDMPFSFYGLGNQTLQSNEDKLEQRLVKLSIEAERQLAAKVYTGLILGFEHYRFKDLRPGGIYDYEANLYGKSGGSIAYLGLSQSFDSRNSNNYPSKGFYGRVSYQYSPSFASSNHEAVGIFKLNLRQFISLSPKIILAAQGVFYSTNGKNLPFYLLQQLGNDELMRGYYTGRFRDEKLLAVQTELRYRFVDRLGIVAFGGFGKVYQGKENLLKSLKPSLGVGGRFFFDPAKGLSLRVDYGIGEKRPSEKRQSGFYISFAEAF